MSTTYEQVIAELELARRLSLGSQFTTAKEKEIDPNDGLVIRALKKYNKLTDSYEKLINHFANARQLITHLQKDLQAEKQDKVHIQKELNDALAILNKPTSEIGTQTDLTAEQITQMEKDLADKNNKVSELQGNLNDLTNQISTLQTEIKGLQEQIKDKEINKAEKELLVCVEKGIETPLAGTILPNELLEKLQDENK